MTIYQTDFAEWATKQADLLRNEEYAGLDVANIIEELESLSARDKRELLSRLTTIMEHMLKIQCEPESRAVNKWQRTIRVQRDDLGIMLDENATLAANVETYLARAYSSAKERAVLGTKCALDDFAQVCPWTAGEVLGK